MIKLDAEKVLQASLALADHKVSRKDLQGIFVMPDKLGAVLAASDGHIAVFIRDESAKGVAAPVTLYFHKEMLRALRKKTQETKRTVEVEGNQARYVVGGQVVHIQTEDTQSDWDYPDILAIVPKGELTAHTVDAFGAEVTQVLVDLATALCPSKKPWFRLYYHPHQKGKGVPNCYVVSFGNPGAFAVLMPCANEGTAVPAFLEEVRALPAELSKPEMQQAARKKARADELAQIVNLELSPEQKQACDAWLALKGASPDAEPCKTLFEVEGKHPSGHVAKLIITNGYKDGPWGTVTLSDRYGFQVPPAQTFKVLAEGAMASFDVKGRAYIVNVQVKDAPAQAA